MATATVQPAEFRDDLRAAYGYVGHNGYGISSARAGAPEHAIGPSEDQFRMGSLQPEERQQVLAQMLRSLAIQADGVGIAPSAVAGTDLHNGHVEASADLAHHPFIGHLQSEHGTLLEHGEAAFAIEQASEVGRFGGGELQVLDRALRHDLNDTEAFT